jgi:predicted MPP superfamily phosphohydrolase
VILFLLTFFLVYGGVHAYVFWKARAALGFGVPGGVLLLLFMLVMVLAPILVRLAERMGLEMLPRLLAWAGYGWMGLLFLFFSVSIILDLYRLTVLLAGLLFRRDLAFLSLSPGAAFTVPLIVAVGIMIYGYFEAWDIRTEKLTILSAKVPEKIGAVRIVLISDVHLGLIVRERRLEKILEAVKEAKPDLLVSAGDLVDGQSVHLDGLTRLLQEIRPKYGKFAVTGNHEFYAGLQQTVAFTEKAGFTVLRGQGVPVGDVINVAGVDDATAKVYGLSSNLSEVEVLAKLPREQFTLLLKHRPQANRDALDGFDLQLSGHVHKGQIFPFNLLTWFFYPVRAGHTLVQNGTHLYVSRGTGTWGPPVRFLAPPEVTLIEVVRAPYSE